MSVNPEAQSGCPIHGPVAVAGHAESNCPENEQDRQGREQQEIAQASVDMMRFVAKNDPQIHGPNLREKLEAIKQLSPTVTLWGHLYSDQSIDTIHNAIVSEVVLSPGAYRTIDVGRDAFYSRKVLDAALGHGLQCDGIRFILYANGQETLFVRKGDKEYRLHPDLYTQLTDEEIQERLQRIGNLIPEVKVTAFSSNESGHRVMVLSERIIGSHTARAEEAIHVAKQLAEITGFVPDVHDGNFMEDAVGDVKYVDGDIIEHVLSGAPFDLTDEGASVLQREIAQYSNPALAGRGQGGVANGI